LVPDLREKLKTPPPVRPYSAAIPLVRTLNSSTDSIGGLDSPMWPPIWMTAEVPSSTTSLVNGRPPAIREVQLSPSTLGVRA
jgi:hypothetical protein